MTELDAVDIGVGKRIKALRSKHNLSQEAIADRLSVTRQQINLYEYGKSKISASKIYELSKLFSIPPGKFFEDIEIKGSDDSLTKSSTIQSKRQTPLNILLIEDDPDDEIHSREAIEDTGIDVDVSVARDGIEALEMLRNNNLKKIPRPDIILLDLQIPKKSGHEVLKDIKSDRTIKNIPVIIVTNCINPEEMERIYNNNASGYILKSMDHELFCDQINATINYWYTIILPSSQYVEKED